MTAALSHKLKELEDYFNARRGMTVQVPSKQVAALSDQLAIMVRIVQSMEAELEAFRLLEADRAGRRFMENEASEALTALMAHSDGKILRPDFRRKS